MNQQNGLAKIEQKNQLTTTRATEVDLFTLGKTFAESGFFQDARDAAQATVKIIYGQELGISPAASMSGIHIISGKPVLSATALAGLIKSRRPGYDYRVIELTDERCELEFYEGGVSVGRSHFSTEQAKQAELLNGKNVNWKKYPQNMLFARAISNGARLYCPDIFVGSPIYTPDELGAQVDAEGSVVLDATSDQGASAKPAQTSAPAQTAKPGFNERNRDLKEHDSDVEPHAPESVLKIRAQIKDMLGAMKVDPTLWLKKFDALETDQLRRDALAKVKKLYDEQTRKPEPEPNEPTQGATAKPTPQTETFFDPERVAKLGIIKDALASQPWNETEIEDYLGQWNIKGVDAASDEIVDSIIADLKDGRII